MQKRYFLLAALYLLANFSVQAQTYQTLLKGGHLIDAKNNINKVMDVAIQDGKIAAVAANIDPKMAKQVIDITGKLCNPRIDRYSRTRF